MLGLHQSRWSFLQPKHCQEVCCVTTPSHSYTLSSGVSYSGIRHTVLCVSLYTLTLTSHTVPTYTLHTLLSAHTVSAHTVVSTHCCQRWVLMATDALHQLVVWRWLSVEHPQLLDVMHVREEQSNKYLHTHTQKHTGGNNRGSWCFLFYRGDRCQDGHCAATEETIKIRTQLFQGGCSWILYYRPVNSKNQGVITNSQ